MKPLSQRIIFVRPKAFAGGALLVSATTLAAALASGGCGSGKGQSPLAASSLSSTAGGGISPGSSSVTRGVGGAKISITWPDKPAATSRIIPQQTQSILIEFFKTDPRLTDASQTPDRWKWVARPPAASQDLITTVTIDNLEARTYFVRVQSLATKLPAVQPPTDPANSALEGTGDSNIDRTSDVSKRPLADTVGTMTIQSGNSNAHLDATLASTIAALKYTYAPDEAGAASTPPLTPNKKYRFSVTATNAAGQQVMVNSDSIHWTGFGSNGDAAPSSTTGASITVRFGSNVTSVNVTVRDFESGKEFLQTFNALTGTFGQPGSVLGVSGAVVQTAAVFSFGVFPSLSDSSAYIELGGTGVGGVPLQDTDTNGGTHPGGGIFYNGNGQFPVVAKLSGSYGVLSTDTAKKSLRFGSVFSPTPIYTSAGTISGFDALGDNVFVGENVAAGFQVAALTYNGFSASVKSTLPIAVVGSSPVLQGVDSFGQIYIASTDTSGTSIRRYDTSGKVDDRYGPLNASSALISPSGRAIIGSTVYSEDGKIRLGSFPASPYTSAPGSGAYSGASIGKFGIFYWRYTATFAQAGGTGNFYSITPFSVDDAK